MAHWLDLPEGVMDLIIDCLEQFGDVARCHAVCTTWYNVAKSILNNKLYHSLPWLLLPNPNPNSNPNQETVAYCSHTLLNLHNNKTLTLDLPELHDRWICCTTNGWLVTMGMSRPYAMHLLDPLSREEISLPGRATFKYPRLDGEDEMSTPIPSFIASAAVRTPTHLKAQADHRSRLSYKPVNRFKNCTVLVIYGNSMHLALCRVGDDKWTHVDEEPSSLCNYNLTFHKPTGLFYIIDNDAFVKRLELDLSSDSLSPKAVTIATPLWDLDQKYLVESVVSGDLWVVLRKIEMPDDHGPNHDYDYDYDSDSEEEVKEVIYYTESFVVLRVDLVTKEMSRVDSLGEEALFLGHNGSISMVVDGDQGSWCRPNCIYFLDDYVAAYSNSKNVNIGCHDMGVFDLDTMRVEKEELAAFKIEKQELRSRVCSTPFYWINFN